MAGMEKLEIHSKSYLLRWVKVQGGQTMSWSITPTKKSIDFGIFRHPGAGAAPTPNLSQQTTEYSDAFPASPHVGERRSSTGRLRPNNEPYPTPEKLKAMGYILVKWYDNLKADQVFDGTWDVSSEQEGMFALVFDNTFSKQLSKTVMFTLMTYPSDAPPPMTYHAHHTRPTPVTANSVGSTSSQRGLNPSQSQDSLQPLGISIPGNTRPNTAIPEDDESSSSSTGFYTGILKKKRRKRGQGYGKRYFSLDFTSTTLSYYLNRDSSALRGAIPLSLAAVAANEKTREISVDSGAEIWHLRALNAKDFTAWVNALEKASRIASKDSFTSSELTKALSIDITAPEAESAFVEDREWRLVEGLTGRLVGTRDAVRRLANSVGRSGYNLGMNSSQMSIHSDTQEGSKDERKPFWKRKASLSGAASPSIRVAFGRSVSGPRIPSPSPLQGESSSGFRDTRVESDIHQHITAVLNDLDSLITDYQAIISQSKQRRRLRNRRISRIADPMSARSRTSVDSFSDAEFYDAEMGAVSDSRLLQLNGDSGEEGETPTAEEYYSEDESGTSSQMETVSHSQYHDAEYSRALFPPKPSSLTPLPHQPIHRRNTIPPATVLPPSLISFFRKNVGKDLSTITMPISANEPLSLLQRYAEQMEYSNILDAACTAPSSDGVRTLYVAAFAISQFANNRVKERAIRKPFNPMLGETFELVRPDLNYRFLAEKVSHRPVILATCAESEKWSLTQAPKPHQKFWGKSVELISEGAIRVILHETGDRYSWSSAASFLRNIIAGEKYVEPVGNMTVTNLTTGEKAVITFKSKGMFSGRSEDVVATVFDHENNPLPATLTGKWTSSISISNPEIGTEKIVWTAGPLVPSAPAHYGFTAFAAQLNEITSLESEKIPITDSRLRPDQRAHEDGDLDLAEDLKTALEEKQRQRRRDLEANHKEWQPKWFRSVGDVELQEEGWELIRGSEGYWDQRAGDSWKGLVDVFDAEL